MSPLRPRHSSCNILAVLPQILSIRPLGAVWLKGTVPFPTWSSRPQLCHSPCHPLQRGSSEEPHGTWKHSPLRPAGGQRALPLGPHNRQSCLLLEGSPGFGVGVVLVTVATRAESLHSSLRATVSAPHMCHVRRLVTVMVCCEGRRQCWVLILSGSPQRILPERERS